MKISLNWLKEFVDIPEDVRLLSRKVTGVGLAVESVEAAAVDTILEVDVTTNRPDCLNHLGVAREVSAIYGARLRKPVIELGEAGPNTADVFSISVADPDLCERYCGRYIAGVRIGASPAWLKERLEAVGVRSINNVADVTNYVLMELGQPLHAFDADTLKGRQIIVRRAEVGEKMMTLDGVERELNPSILVIADAERAVAVAGVMGGAETEISSSTTNVLLESACFNSLSIRKTSRALALSTEASYRFERGADVEMARLACDRAARMIQELAGGQVYRGVIDVYPERRKPAAAALRRRRIETFLGGPVEDAIVERILSRLEFEVSRTDEGWLLRVPSFRVDVSREEDLLEEVARHHGYDKFPSTLPVWSGSGSYVPLEAGERLLRNLLSSCGYSETIGLAFSDESIEGRFRPNAEPVKFLNPMSEDHSILRTSLVPTMLRAIQWNLNRGIRDMQLYELGKVYQPGDERRSLIIAGTGALRPRGVHDTEKDFDFFDLKGDVEHVLETFGVELDLNGPGIRARSGEERDPHGEIPAYYHPLRSAGFGSAAVFGELHPEYAESFKLRQRVYIAELDVDNVLKSRERRMAQAIPRFPSIRRDLSLLLDKATRYADVHAVVAGAGVPELIRIEPFDRLESGSFPDSKYSLSILLVYQSTERTLTDSEVEKYDRQILTLLEDRLGAALRK
jgi:phenylalanyl-tRNA synthetase beta chain